MESQDLKTKSASFNPMVIVGAFAVLLILIFVMLGIGKGEAPATQTPIENKKVPAFTKETINLKSVDLSTAKTDTEKLPAGFPSLIPVETKGIFVSDTKVYSDKVPQIITYTIKYKTSKTVTEKYNEYLDYMTKGGYKFASEGGKDVKNHALYGSKDGAGLTVSANLINGQTVVQISYTFAK